MNCIVRMNRMYSSTGASRGGSGGRSRGVITDSPATAMSAATADPDPESTPPSGKTEPRRIKRTASGELVVNEPRSKRKVERDELSAVKKANSVNPSAKQRAMDYAIEWGSKINTAACVLNDDGIREVNMLLRQLRGEPEVDENSDDDGAADSNGTPPYSCDSPSCADSPPASPIL